MSDATAFSDQRKSHKDALSLADVARTTGLGKTALYAAMRDGRLAARKFGRRTIVLKRDLKAFLDALPRRAA